MVASRATRVIASSSPFKSRGDADRSVVGRAVVSILITASFIKNLPIPPFVSRVRGGGKSPRNAFVTFVTFLKYGRSISLPPTFVKFFGFFMGLHTTFHGFVRVSDRYRQSHFLQRGYYISCINDRCGRFVLRVLYVHFRLYDSRQIECAVLSEENHFTGGGIYCHYCGFPLQNHINYY